MKTTTFIAFFGLCAGPALACPTAADLNTGITTIETDGTTSVYRNIEPGIVAQEIDFKDGSFGKNQLAQGVYVLRLAIEDGGVLDLQSIYATTYDRPVTELPLPKPGLTMTMRTTVTTTDDSYKEQQQHAWGPLETVTIGECAFNGITGTIEYKSGFDPFTETVLYLPDLGIGLLTAYAYEGEAPEIYEYVSITSSK